MGDGAGLRRTPMPWTPCIGARLEAKVYLEVKLVARGPYLDLCCLSYRDATLNRMIPARTACLGFYKRLRRYMTVRREYQLMLNV